MCFICDLRAGPTPDAPDAPDSHRWSSRRGFLLAAAAAAGTLASPGQAQVQVGPPSRMRQLVPAETLEKAASQQYLQMMQQAHSQGALLPESHPQVQRLHTIARRLIPHAAPWNPRARDWKWQVQLIRSDQINAFCMPGGKIGFFTGILDQLKLDDDETAMIMGHEMAHALREHARERLAKSSATDIGLRLGASLLGLGAGTMKPTPIWSAWSWPPAAPTARRRVSACGRRWHVPAAVAAPLFCPPTPAARTGFASSRRMCRRCRACLRQRGSSRVSDSLTARASIA